MFGAKLSLGNTRRHNSDQVLEFRSIRFDAADRFKLLNLPELNHCWDMKIHSFLLVHCVKKTRPIGHGFLSHIITQLDCPGESAAAVTSL